MFAWLGVVPYLTREAVEATLVMVGRGTAPGSEIIFDYAESPDRLDPVRRAAFEVMARRVASIGEPFMTFFAPDEVARLLAACGFGWLDDLDADALNARYRGTLRVGGIGHLMRACV